MAAGLEEENAAQARRLEELEGAMAALREENDGLRQENQLFEARVVDADRQLAAAAAGAAPVTKKSSATIAATIGALLAVAVAVAA